MARFQNAPDRLKGRKATIKKCWTNILDGFTRWEPNPYRFVQIVGKIILLVFGHSRVPGDLFDHLLSCPTPICYRIYAPGVLPTPPELGDRSF